MKNHFKIITTITLLVILITLLSIWIFSGSLRSKAEGIGGETVMTLDIKQLTQDPKTLEIPLALSVYSTRDSDRIQISWEVLRGIEIKGDASTFITVSKDHPTVIEKRFKASQAGRFDIKVKAQMFTAEVNYVSSASYTLPVSNEFEALPITDEYKSAKFNYQTREVLKYVGIGLVILTLGVAGFIGFRKWLNAED